jgi:hypothetical protein
MCFFVMPIKSRCVCEGFLTCITCVRLRCVFGGDELLKDDIGWSVAIDG